MATTHVSYRQESKKDYGQQMHPHETLCMDQLNAGAILRIADSLERMEKPYLDLLNKVKRLEGDTEFLVRQCDKKDRQIRGLRGALKRRKKI